MKISQFYWELMAAGLPLMKNVLTPLSKRDCIPLGLSAGMSAADPTEHQLLAYQEMH